jgi:hypothetical protein
MRPSIPYTDVISVCASIPLFSLAFYISYLTSKLQIAPYTELSCIRIHWLAIVNEVRTRVVRYTFLAGARY